MRCKNLWKRIVPFALTFMLGVFSVNVFGQKIQTSCVEQPQIGGGISDTKPREGSGTSGGDSGTYGKTFDNKTEETFPSDRKPLRIISKPRAKYTDEAESRCIQGTVVLRVTFFANGKVGNFKIIEGLDYGLSEQAIEAAKLIKFEPAIKNGKPVTIIKSVKYNFTIY